MFGELFCFEKSRFFCRFGSISVLELLFSAKSAYYALIRKRVLESKGNKWRKAERTKMTIDALFFASLDVLFFVEVLWGIGKAHSFEQEVAWSQRKE